jgi:hypothetical protein
VDDVQETDVREELRLVDEELAGLRARAHELRAGLGERNDGPVDLAENAAVITAAEEQEALIDALEQRRAGLLRRLA